LIKVLVRVDTKWLISETSFPVSRLASTEDIVLEISGVTRGTKGGK